jgi:hypothetical protein
LIANAHKRIDYSPLLRRRAPSVGGETAAPTNALSWATTNAQIVHPALGRIAFEPYPYQRVFLDAYDDSRRLILKARQIGFSQVFALEALYTATTQPEQTILLVSRSQDLAVNLLRYCYLTYNNLKDAPEMRKANESEMGFANGSRIKSIPANRSTGRGFAANAVYLDEFAYAEYADEIYQSVSPSISQGGRLVIGSTPNGVGNLFHTLYLNSDGFTRFIEPWYHCPMYWTEDEQARGVPKEESAWSLRERPKYTQQQWAAEYECDFVGSGEAVFSVDAIGSARVGALGDQAPIDGRTYVTSVDIGRRQDATVINTFDTSAKPYQRVAHKRVEGMSYPLIQQLIEARARLYPGSLWVESNGVGDPVIENLNVRARPFVTTARSKVQALQSLALLLERGELKAQWTTQEQYELTIYRYDDRDLVQDCVMSLAIGADALVSQRTSSAVGAFAR